MKKWFTIIELITVITILAILSTIAFKTLKENNAEKYSSLTREEKNCVIKCDQVFKFTNQWLIVCKQKCLNK